MHPLSIRTRAISQAHSSPITPQPPHSKNQARRSSLTQHIQHYLLAPTTTGLGPPRRQPTECNTPQPPRRVQPPKPASPGSVRLLRCQLPSAQLRTTDVLCRACPMPSNRISGGCSSSRLRSQGAMISPGTLFEPRPLALASSRRGAGWTDLACGSPLCPAAASLGPTWWPG